MPVSPARVIRLRLPRGKRQGNSVRAASGKERQTVTIIIVTEDITGKETKHFIGVEGTSFKTVTSILEHKERHQSHYMHVYIILGMAPCMYRTSNHTSIMYVPDDIGAGFVGRKTLDVSKGKPFSHQRSSHHYRKKVVWKIHQGESLV